MRVTLQHAATAPALLRGTIHWWPKQRELLSSLDGPERMHVWSIGRQTGKSSPAACAAVHDVSRKRRSSVPPRPAPRALRALMRSTGLKAGFGAGFKDDVSRVLGVDGVAVTGIVDPAGGLSSRWS